MASIVFPLWNVAAIWGAFCILEFHCDGKLLLSQFISTGKIAEAQNLAFVSGIEELISTNGYSGYLTVNEKYHSNMFFWYFPSETEIEIDPIILWLQGAPSKSSLAGIFLDSGPFIIHHDHLYLRQTFLPLHNSILYMDPIGAGYSHTDKDGYAHHSKINQIAEDLYNALLQFFQLFPNVQKAPFYISGLSYGGKYATILADLIDSRNNNSKTKINLVGIMLGNSLIDPEHQLRYSDFMYELGFVNLLGKKTLEGYHRKMVNHINNKQWMEAYSTYYTEMVDDKSYFRKLTGFVEIGNILEIAPSYTKEYTMRRYLNKPNIKKALHAGNQMFLPCDPYFEYGGEMMQSAAPILSKLINKYRVLVYSGELDINILYRTTVDYLVKLNFAGSEGYAKTPRQLWYRHRELAGYVTQVGNLTEVFVRKAGPNVHRDQLDFAEDMFHWFTRDDKFATTRDP